MLRKTLNKPWLIVVAGGLLVAALDAVFFTAYWTPQGVPPTRILQHVASGLLGPASFKGGVATIWLGAFLHCAIATVMVLTFFLANQRVPRLAHHPVRYGLPYGLVLWIVMTQIVVPLSLAPEPAGTNVPWMLSSIAMHAVIGVICAWVVKLTCLPK